MLDELRIRSLGVIDDAVLPLGPGLTVVTGETGAGKTMVVTGLLLLFGDRADAARVRTGAAQASVDGRVLVGGASRAAERVRSAGGELDECEQVVGADAAGQDHELSLRRVVNAGGRSRAYVGGAPAPISVLTELAEELLAVHGQSDQLRLTRPGAQRAALDRYAGIDTATLAGAYATWQAATTALAQRFGRAAELRRESDLLEYGIAEIDQAAPAPDEAEQLNRLAARLGDADALRSAARTAHALLLGDVDDPAPETADVSGLLATATRALSHQQDADVELDGLATRLADLSAAAIDIGGELRNYADQLDTDPARLDEVETRRAVLANLVRKYCDEPEPSLDGVLRWADAARKRLAEIDVSDDAIALLRAQVDAAASELVTLALDVSRRRHAAAKKLAAAVSDELSGLAMPDARLHIEVTIRPAGQSSALVVDGAEVGVTAEGIDEVTLLLQPHPGSPALPIARGASGGELSRIMLALEVSLIGAAGAHSPSTLVFDEVDAGVGGRAAVEVGRRLARLARDRQVLVVTHLAQVAAFADRHVVVDKPTGGDPANPAAVTASDVRAVVGDERLAELARMLSGSDTQAARKHAAELLEQCADEPGASAQAPAPRRRRTASRT